MKVSKFIPLREQLSALIQADRSTASPLLNDEPNKPQLNDTNNIKVSMLLLVALSEFPVFF